MDYTEIQCIAESIDGQQCRFLLKKEGSHPLIVVGLNPSTADESAPDATMRKIMGFIKKWKENNLRGYDSFIMLNLYPLRETSPAELNKYQFNDYLHTRNMEIISSVLDEHPRTEILLCYGDSIEKIPWLKYCRDEILKLIAQYPHSEPLRLGELTIKNNPRHPCRLAYNTDLKSFNNPFFFQCIGNM